MLQKVDLISKAVVGEQMFVRHESAKIFTSCNLLQYAFSLCMLFSDLHSTCY